MGNREIIHNDAIYIDFSMKEDMHNIWLCTSISFKWGCMSVFFIVLSARSSFLLSVEKLHLPAIYIQLSMQKLVLEDCWFPYFPWRVVENQLRANCLHGEHKLRWATNGKYEFLQHSENSNLKVVVYDKHMLHKSSWWKQTSNIYTVVWYCPLST